MMNMLSLGKYIALINQPKKVTKESIKKSLINTFRAILSKIKFKSNCSIKSKALSMFKKKHYHYYKTLKLFRL